MAPLYSACNALTSKLVAIQRSCCGLSATLCVRLPLINCTTRRGSVRTRRDNLAPITGSAVRAAGAHSSNFDAPCAMCHRVCSCRAQRARAADPDCLMQRRRQHHHHRAHSVVDACHYWQILTLVRHSLADLILTLVTVNHNSLPAGDGQRDLAGAAAEGARGGAAPGEERGRGQPWAATSFPCRPLFFIRP